MRPGHQRDWVGVAIPPPTTKFEVKLVSAFFELKSMHACTNECLQAAVGLIFPVYVFFSLRDPRVYSRSATIERSYSVCPLPNRLTMCGHD